MKTKSRQDEGEFTDLGQACRHRERGIQRITEKQNETKCRQRFAEDDDREDHENVERLAYQHLGVEQHADRNEKQHRESIPQWQRFFSGPVAKMRLPHDHAGEESAESEGHAE